MQFEGHADPRHHHLPEQLHVREDPLVSHRGDPEVSFEQGVEPVQEGLQVTEREERFRFNIQIQGFIVICTLAKV